MMTRNSLLAKMKQEDGLRPVLLFALLVLMFRLVFRVPEIPAELIGSETGFACAENRQAFRFRVIVENAGYGPQDRFCRAIYRKAKSRSRIEAGNG